MIKELLNCKIGPCSLYKHSMDWLAKSVSEILPLTFPIAKNIL